jgi:hypothetical protein
VEAFGSSFAAIWGVKQITALLKSRVFDSTQKQFTLLLKIPFMKKVLVFVVFTCFFFFVACNTRSAFNYSEEVVKMEKSLVPQIEETEKKVNEYFTAGKYDSIAAVSGRMESSIQNAMDKLNNIPVPDVKEAEKFKASFMKYFNFMKSVYTEYKKMGLAATDDERNKYLQEVQRIASGRFAVMSEVQTAQKAFAEANGFKVQ